MNLRSDTGLVEKLERSPVQKCLPLILTSVYPASEEEVSESAQIQFEVNDVKLKLWRLPNTTSLPRRPGSFHSSPFVSAGKISL